MQGQVRSTGPQYTIRFLREQRRLSVEELAARLKVSPEDFRRWEEGAASPSEQQRYFLAGVFGVAATDLAPPGTKAKGGRARG